MGEGAYMGRAQFGSRHADGYLIYMHMCEEEAVQSPESFGPPMDEPQKAAKQLRIDLCSI
jgi:hypothetical protein